MDDQDYCEWLEDQRKEADGKALVKIVGVFCTFAILVLAGVAVFA